MLFVRDRSRRKNAYTLSTLMSVLRGRIHKVSAAAITLLFAYFPFAVPSQGCNGFGEHHFAKSA
jgi:phenylalanyl-tRNA synthetase alpha subunit